MKREDRRVIIEAVDARLRMARADLCNAEILLKDDMREGTELYNPCCELSVEARVRFRARVRDLQRALRAVEAL